MSTPISAEKVVTWANKTLNALAALDLEIDEKINDIYDAADSERRPVNDAEKKQVNQLRASQGDISAARKTLALVAASLLDQSADVQELNKSLKRVNQQVQDDLASLQGIVDTAHQAAAAAGYLSQAAEGLAQVAAKVALGSPR